MLVAAPTGAGKTVVGEFAAWLALERGGKTFYTTPIKALSNQKYTDFLGLHGTENVGLLTGDNSINAEASIVVMTTEVLRNMIYEDSPTLHSLHYVVLDEIHYLQDPYRGAVWEEVLIHLPVDVQIASLSATVSNAEEFAEWLQTLRGRTEVIIEERRPVEIRHWYFTADGLVPMFVAKPDGAVVPNPRARDFDRRRRRSAAPRPGRGGHRDRGRRPRIPFRTDVIEGLDREAMLPAIYFIFSRKGCDDAVKRCLMENLGMTSPDERRRIREYADLRVADLPPEELDVLGYAQWIAGLESGIAAHHAGMIPPFKEAVEELFRKGLIKVVFATETLALGINMPARTVVIESLTKFTGEKHELMTPGEYTQLSGRAGRRGIDELGHSVVLMQRFTPFDTISRLASTRTYPLKSSFQPSYNMAVNLVRTYERAEAEHLVNSSFAQFQADRDVVQLERTRERNEAYLASYHERMRCERGDVTEYRRLVDRLRAAEARVPARARSAAVTDAIERLRPGDVVEIPTGKRRGRYVVLQVSRRPSERAPRILAVSEERSSVRLSVNDFRAPPQPVAHVRLPRGFQHRDAGQRRALARRLAGLVAQRPATVREDPDASKELKSVRRSVESHPVNSCPDRHRHLHYAERAARLEREVAGIGRRISRRTGTLARRFERVLEVLAEFGCIDGWALTDKGELLTGVYNECDLLVVEALTGGVLDELDAPELACVLSTLVYETRGPEPVAVPVWPTPAALAAWKGVLELWERVRTEEERRDLALTREPDPGFAEVAYRWASGAPLERVLSDDEAPGDFVRSMKQLLDLLRQLDELEVPATALRNVHGALTVVNRGVVAYSSVDV